MENQSPISKGSVGENPHKDKCNTRAYSHGFGQESKIVESAL